MRASGERNGEKMTELLTAAQMRAIEQAAIASGKVTGLELMERAGRGVVQAIWDEWPELAQGSFRAIVLCGPGNNGGDGFVVARLLKQWGWQVEVFLHGTPDRMPPDARTNLDRWNGPVRPLEDCDFDSFPGPGDGVDLVVEALFGIGLSRPVDGLDCLQMQLNTCRAAARHDRRYPRVVAVDVPAGLSADTGLYPGVEADNPLDTQITANLTVTFHRMKQGHVLALGPASSGKVVVVDIGLDEVSGEVALVTPRSALLGKGGGHKFSHGHALVLSGASGQGGAARLAARGALRIGAGLVTLAPPPEALTENAARLDAVMLKPVADGEALEAVLGDPRINALCIGPGLGVERAREMARVALGRRGSHRRALVVDADGLTALSRDPALLAALHPDCVLTPHGGEFARLFPDIAAKLKAPAYSKVDATREAAARAGCVVLFKGPDTVIAGPTGRCAISAAVYDRAAPWLATAGSGDVLAGFITGLLARGFSAFDAACMGAWLHVECARSFGPGLIAEDLPDELPKVFRALRL